MPARREHDQAAVPEPEAGRVLVPMLVWHRLARELTGSEMVIAVEVWVAAGAIDRTISDDRVRQHALHARAWNDARREGVPLDDNRRLREHSLDAELTEPA